jgi:hypothetical protein
MLEQDRTFTVCQDPEDERQLSSCKDPAKDAVTIELNCKCTDPAVPPEECPDQCPHHKGLCDLTKVFPFPRRSTLRPRLRGTGAGDSAATRLVYQRARVQRAEARPQVPRTRYFRAAPPRRMVRQGRARR